MRAFLIAVVACTAVHPITISAAQPEVDRLPRRADLGAVVAPPTASAPARVVRIEETSALFSAGLRAGDQVLALDRRPFGDAVDFAGRMAALRAGQTVRLGVSRDGHSLEIMSRLPAMPRDRIQGTEVVYTQIRNPTGLWQRAILTRPERASGRLPAMLFVPWLSCDSIETPGAAPPGINELLYKLAAESGWVLLRVDKPGVGDSEGVCGETDLDTEIAGSRAALKWLQAHPWVDAARIVLVGQSFSGAFLPLVAGKVPVAGYVVMNSWVRTWLERLLEFERLQAEASGMSPGDVSERQRKLSEFYALFLEQQKTPRQVIQERPELADVWTDSPEHQYARSARFHHQLQRINAAGAWSRVSVPTLAIWGDADPVMHRSDHERLVALVNRSRAGAAVLVVAPGANHGLAVRGADGRPHLSPVVFQAIRGFLDRLNAPSRSVG